MSSERDRRGELAWGAFAVACAVAMLVFPAWESVPFHWIWITLTFLYGFRRWSSARTAAVLGVVVAVTTVAMVRSGDSLAEMSEIPLMTCVFLGMVWHVRRRQDAVDAEHRAAERERDFMRDAAHNLRTPLTVAQGHAELLRESLPPDSTEHADTTVLLDELRRLTRISDQLLLLGSASRPDAVLLAPVDLQALAGTVAHRWSVAAGRAIEVAEGRPVVCLADEQRVRHALDALIENALHATAPGDAITVRALVRDGDATLEVADAGAGIAPDDLERVFDRFARGADAEHAGTGLGLAIVRAIATAHGGDVAIRSEPGQGTTVTVRLGAERPAVRSAAARQLAPRPAHG